MLASSASSVTPERLTNAPTAEAPNAIEPAMFTQAARQSRDFNSATPTVMVTATIASVALTRNATEPCASGAHTNRRWVGIRWASNAAAVLTLKSRVPTNWIAAERKSARADRSAHDRLAGVLLLHLNGRRAGEEPGADEAQGVGGRRAGHRGESRRCAEGEQRRPDHEEPALTPQHHVHRHTANHDLRDPG